MPGQHVSDRPKLRWEKLLLPALPGERVSAERGVCSEFLEAAIRILDSFMFLVGSVCFFSWMGHRTVMLGDWLYILGSCLSCLLSAWSILELIAEHRYLKDMMGELAQHELLEAMTFFLANVVFAVGSVFFMPGLYASAEDDNWAKRMGAWLYIGGSFGSVTAGYYNSLAIAARSRECHAHDAGISSSSYLAKIELWFTTMGSVCFSVGSFLYQPSYDHCRKILPLEERLSSFESIYAFAPRRLRPHAVLQPLLEETNSTIPPSEVRKVCLAVVDEGTWMFVVGSVLYLVQALLQLWRAGVAQADKERRDRSQFVRRYTADAF